LRPGVTEFVVHIAFDDAEMKAISLDHPNWGAAWRERDFQFLTSDAFRKVLEENNVKLITCATSVRFSMASELPAFSVIPCH
jgi:hypothetical protein